MVKKPSQSFCNFRGSTTGETQTANGPVIKQLQVTAQSAVLPKIVSGPTYTEPMDCLPNNAGGGSAVAMNNDDSPMESAPTTPMVVPIEETSDALKPPESPTMMVEPSETPPASVEHGPLQSPLMVKDLLILTQMFYLPSEHGQHGLDLLNEFYWLKRNGTAMIPLGKYLLTLLLDDVKNMIDFLKMFVLLPVSRKLSGPSDGKKNLVKWSQQFLI